jgi:acetolactate decarboxylase
MTIDHELVHSLTVDRVRRRQLSGVQVAEREIVQVQMVQALMDGCYDGDVTIGELQGKGDFGIGTLQGLDGELIVVDGEFWNVDFDGRAQLAAPDARVPFAVLIDFDEVPTERLTGPLDRPAFEALLLDRIPDPDGCYAVLLHGEFSTVQFRSVKHQEPPYRPLLDVLETDQQLFERTDLRGTLVGFYFPNLAAGLNIPGFHLHLLTDDRATGGHCFTFEMISGELSLQPATRVHLELPERGMGDLLGLDEPLRSVQLSLVRHGTRSAPEVAAELALGLEAAREALAILEERGYADAIGDEPSDEARYRVHLASTRPRRLPSALDDL